MDDSEMVSFLDDLRRHDEIVEEIAAFLIANKCAVSRDVLRIRFADVPDERFEMVIEDMIDRGLITVVTTADGDDLVVLTAVPGSGRCDNVVVTVTFSRLDKVCGDVTICQDVSLDRASMELLVTDIRQVLESWGEWTCESGGSD